jgi:sugar-specific transcriptional regulator TrmB
MNQLEEKLSALGLSSQESRVYLSLLRGGRMTGYQIAKDLGISRSGVYNVLQSLYRRCAAYLLPGRRMSTKPPIQRALSANWNSASAPPPAA